jgi:hypothetical protein
MNSERSYFSWALRWLSSYGMYHVKEKLQLPCPRGLPHRSLLATVTIAIDFTIDEKRKLENGEVSEIKKR